MNRLQRKCLVFSGSLHGFLVLLLLVGAGFQPAREDLSQNMAILTFVPDLLTDQPVMGGGSPEVTAPSAPRQPVPEPEAAQPPAPNSALLFRAPGRSRSVDFFGGYDPGQRQH